MIWQRKQRFPVDTVSMLLMHLHSRITLKMQLIYIFLSTAKSKHTFCGSDAHKKEKMLRKLIFFCSVIEWKSQFYFKVMLLCMFLKCAERKWENFCFKVKKNLVKSEKLCGFSMRERKKWENSKFQQIDSTIFLLVYWWTIFRRLRPRTINKLHLIY